MENKISLQELEILLTTSLTKFGLSSKPAHSLARETVVKARKKLNPSGLKGAAITVEDSFKVSKTITLFIKRSVKRKPELILERFVADRKGYPDISNWIVEEVFGGLESSRREYKAILKSTIKSTKKRDIQEIIFSEFQSLPKEEQLKITKQLQAQL